MTKEKIIEILKENCYKGEFPNGKTVYEFAEGDLDQAAKQILKQL